MALLKPPLALVAILAFVVMHDLCIAEVGFVTQASKSRQT